MYQQLYRYLPALLTVLALSALSGAICADSTSTRGHSLFNPTPREQMRPLSTDRPDKTESPYTVDAGHLQIESDLFNLAFTDIGDEHWREGTVLGLNIKIGLTDRADLQIVIPTFSGESQWIDGVHSQSKFPTFGTFESILFRCKVNLRGNDSPGPAVALMPYFGVSLQDEANGDYSAGIIAPVALPINDTYSASCMLVLGQDHESGTTSKAAQVSGSLGRDLSSSLGAYVELFSEFREHLQPNATFDTGLTLGLSSGIQLDLGINLGLTDIAADYNPFLGLTIRI